MPPIFRYGGIKIFVRCTWIHVYTKKYFRGERDVKKFYANEGSVLGKQSYLYNSYTLTNFSTVVIRWMNLFYLNQDWANCLDGLDRLYGLSLHGNGAGIVLHLHSSDWGRGCEHRGGMWGRHGRDRCSLHLRRRRGQIGRVLQDCDHWLR
jgi:hypothetical protein